MHSMVKLVSYEEKYTKAAKKKKKKHFYNPKKSK